MNAAQVEKKKENLLKLMKVLRETDVHLTPGYLAKQIEVSPSTMTRYLALLPQNLEDNEKVDTIMVAPAPGMKIPRMAYKIVCKADRYDSKKTEGGCADPTAAKAMDNYMKEDTKVRDWKYNIGDVWYVINTKSMLDPYVIISTFADKAIMLRIYEDTDIQNKSIDLNDPNLIGMYGKVIDTGFMCTKPFKWLTDKATYSFSEEDMADIRNKVARNLHLFEEVFEKKALVEAGQQILELSDKLEKMKQARDEWAKNCQEAEAKVEELRKELALADEARDKWMESCQKAEDELARAALTGDKPQVTIGDRLDACTREMYKLKIEMLTEERDRLSNLLFASFGVKQ